MNIDATIKIKVFDSSTFIYNDLKEGTYAANAWIKYDDIDLSTGILIVDAGNESEAAITAVKFLLEKLPEYLKNKRSLNCEP